MYFFFFKQKTAYEMRISDWSSDVCSSDLGDVEAARGHVGGHQHACLAGLEQVQRLLPLRLALVAVDRDGAQAGGLELFGEAVAAVLGLAEHQHLVGVAAAQDLDQQVALARAVDRMGDRKSTRLNSSH